MYQVFKYQSAAGQEGRLQVVFPFLDAYQVNKLLQVGSRASPVMNEAIISWNEWC